MVNRWSDEDIETLRELYPTESRSLLTFLLKRDWQRIREKASSLKIKRIRWQQGDKSVDRRELKWPDKVVTSEVKAKRRKREAMLKTMLKKE